MLCFKSARLLFEPRDLWVGIYWCIQSEPGFTRQLHIYLCLIPMLPLRLSWWLC